LNDPDLAFFKKKVAELETNFFSTLYISSTMTYELYTGISELPFAVAENIHDLFVFQKI